MLPPRAWAAATPARLLLRILRDGSCGSRLTGQPPGGHPLHVVGAGRGFLLVGADRRLGGLLGQWTRMPHEQAPLRRRHPPIAVRHRHGPDDAVPRPLATRGVLAPPRLLSEEGQGRLLLAPRFPCLAYRTRAWPQGDQAQPLCQAQASRPATLRLARRHAPWDALQAQGEARRERDRRCHPVPRLPIPHPSPQRHSALTAHAQTQESLGESATPVLPLPRGRTGAPGGWGAASYSP